MNEISSLCVMNKKDIYDIVGHCCASEQYCIQVTLLNGNTICGMIGKNSDFNFEPSNRHGFAKIPNDFIEHNSTQLIECLVLYYDNTFIHIPLKEISGINILKFEEISDHNKDGYEQSAYEIIFNNLLTEANRSKFLNIIIVH